MIALPALPGLASANRAGGVQELEDPVAPGSKTDEADGSFEVVHARLLLEFPAIVAELGGDPAALLGELGIPWRASHNEAPRATYGQAVRAIQLAAEQLDCPDFGMRLAARQGGGVFGPLGQVMKNSRTLGEALNYVQSHTYAHSLAARVWLKHLPDDGGTFFGHDILVEGVTAHTQAIEQLLLIGHLFAMEMTGGHARVRKVMFRHQPVSSLKTYRRYFGCEVRFGQNNDGVIYADHDLACPISAPDSAAYESAVAFVDAHFHCQRPPTHALVRGLVMHKLWVGNSSNDQVANALNLHPRTLHRQLASEGTSFRQIKDEVRRDLLLYYLQQTQVDLAAVAEKLGFAEQSVLTRRCRQWFGAPPTHVRRQHRSRHGTLS